MKATATNYDVCCLSLHHLYHPTIPTHEQKSKKVFVLLGQSELKEDNTFHPYVGSVFPVELSPYEDLLIIRQVDQRQTKKQTYFPTGKRVVFWQ